MKICNGGWWRFNVQAQEGMMICPKNWEEDDAEKKHTG